MPTVSIRLFAAASQIAESNVVRLVVTTHDRPRVLEVVQQLLLEYPQLQSIASRSRWAINDDFVELDAVVHENDHLAMIPPVSGG